MITSKPNEDGVVFVTGKENKYFVIYDIEGELSPMVETAREIFRRMEFSDCYDISIKRLWLIKGDYITSARFLNVWHDPKDPLRVDIKDTITNEIYDSGYQPEH